MIFKHTDWIYGKFSSKKFILHNLKPQTSGNFWVYKLSVLMQFKFVTKNTTTKGEIYEVWNKF